jgi:hypothetical protein
VEIHDQRTLFEFLRGLNTQISAADLDAVVGEALFRDGKCLGMSYQLLKDKLTVGQFEQLLFGLNVQLPLGIRGEPSKVRPHEYPTGGNPPCVPRDDAFCNPD